MTWILVLYIYAGSWAKGDSVTTTIVPGFTSQAECAAAGKTAEPLVEGSSKNLRFACLRQTK